MHVVFFDIDGTLLDSGGAGRAALEAALLEEFAILRVTGSVPFAGRTDRAIMRDLLTQHGIEASEENLQRFVSGYLQRLPHTLVARKGGVLPGIREILDALRCRDDIALGLLTGNLQAGAKAKLGHYGLYDYFSFGGFGDRHFLREHVAQEALESVRRFVCRNISPRQVWVIGDTPADIACARAIGANVAAVATGLHSRGDLALHHPDLLFDDLAEPQRLLRLWQ